MLRAEGAELRAVPAALPGRGSRHVSSHARAAPVGELVARLLPAAGREPPAIRDRARARPWRGQCAGLGACVPVSGGAEGGQGHQDSQQDGSADPLRQA